MPSRFARRVWIMATICLQLHSDPGVGLAQVCR